VPTRAGTVAVSFKPPKPPVSASLTQSLSIPIRNQRPRRDAEPGPSYFLRAGADGAEEMRPRPCRSEWLDVKSCSPCDACHMLKNARLVVLLKSIAWEAIMRNPSITQLIIGTAFAVGMSVIAISAVAQSSVEPTQEVLTNRSTPISETEFRLSDHQQLKGYFFDGRFR
jgi:hypothetical protein